ncbi:MAG: glycosyltransferase family 39 protein [Clostridia bacterium]|nr:glycosyltransferase family 39 protein [Clostridia bacterium]
MIKTTRLAKTKKRWMYWVLWGILLGIGAVLLFVKIQDHAVALYDEARHGINAYEMYQRQDGLVNTYGWKPDYVNLKPPYSFWAIMGGYALFGFNSLALRYYSALSMLLTMLIVSLWVKKRYGPMASLIALAFFLADRMVYTDHFSRAGDADALYVLLYTAGMLCMLDSPRNIRRLYGSAFCFGLAFMTKSYHAALIPLTCLLYLCMTRQIKKIKIKNYLLLIGFGLLPVVPWAIARYFRDGFAFLGQMFATDVVERTTVIQSDDLLFYFKELTASPISIMGFLLCGGLLFSRWASRNADDLRASPDERTSGAIGLALWVFIPPVLFTFFSFKVWWYAFPSFPGLYAAGGIAAAALYRSISPKRLARASAAVAVMVLLVYTGINLVRILNTQNTNTYQRVIGELLEREADSGAHVYIQYDETLSQWSDADRLCAMWAGDALCLDGGAKAFQEDEEGGLLFVNKEGFDDSLLEFYPIVAETGYIYVLMD